MWCHTDDGIMIMSADERIYSMFSKNAQTVLEKRYLQRDESGVIAETVDELFQRVARSVAAAERTWGAGDVEVKATEQRFYASMIHQEFMPNSPTLMNAGKEHGQLSA